MCLTSLQIPEFLIMIYNIQEPKSKWESQWIPPNLSSPCLIIHRVLFILSILLFLPTHYSPSDFYYICLSSSLHRLKPRLFFHTRLTSLCPFPLLPCQACHSPVSFTCSLELVESCLPVHAGLSKTKSLCLSLQPHLHCLLICQPTAPILNYLHVPMTAHTHLLSGMLSISLSS